MSLGDTLLPCVHIALPCEQSRFEALPINQRLYDIKMDQKDGLGH